MKDPGIEPAHRDGVVEWKRISNQFEIAFTTSKTTENLVMLNGQELTTIFVIIFQFLLLNQKVFVESLCDTIYINIKPNKKITINEK